MKVNERTSAEKGRVTTLSKKTKEELIEVILKKEKTIAARDKKINWLDSVRYAAIDKQEKLYSEVADLTETNTHLKKVNDTLYNEKMQFKRLADEAVAVAEKTKVVNDEAIATIEKYEKAMEVYRTDMITADKAFNERIKNLNKEHESEVSAYLTQIQYQAKNIKVLKWFIGVEMIVIALLFLSYVIR